MFVNRPVILTAVMFVAVTAVHSQSANPDEAGGQSSAPLFAAAPPSDGGRDLTNAEKLQSLLGRVDRPGAPPRPVAQPAGVQPWAFALPKPPTASPDGDPSNRDNAIDLSALRYFASQNDLARVAAEIRFIRLKHPDWEPPEDLFNESKGGEQEKPLWDLFSKHDYEGVYAAIAQIQQATPDWQPSADLLGKLTLAEANQKLVEASDAGQWDAVIEIAAANKMLLTCAYVDTLWRTAEALAHSDDEARALEAYRYILANCSKPEERLATVQKASLVIKSPEEFEGMLQMGRRLSSGKSEFESVRLDLIRREIGDAAAGNAGPAPSQNEVDALATYARKSADQNDQQLLGWFAYSRKDYVQAESWFRIALQSGLNAKAAEGLVLTLRAADKIPEAEKLAVQYAPLDHLNRKLMVEVLSDSLVDPKANPLSNDDLGGLVRAIDGEQSADGAQAYGWYAYKANDIVGAEGWFRKSMTWQANESAAIGLVVTARRLNQTRDYADLVARYHETYPKIGEFDALMRASYHAPASHAGPRRASVARGDGGWDKSADAAVKSLEAGDYEKALATLDERKQHGRSESAGLAVVRGWALYHKGDWEGAKKVFASAGAMGLPDKADEGLSIIRNAELPTALRR